MNCPNCGAENPDDSRFCGECGTPLAGAPAAAPPTPVLAQTPVTPPARAATLAPAVICPHCGAPNAPTAQWCQSCGGSLGTAGGRPPAPAAPVTPTPVSVARGPAPAAGRPGCVTAYVILGVIGLLLSIVETISTMGQGSAVGLYTLVVAIIQVPILVGLWRMRNWARVALLVLGALSVIILLIGAVALIGVGSGAEYLGVGYLVAIAVEAYVLYWFARHRAQFS